MTNAGTKPLTVVASSRKFAAATSSSQSVPFDATTLPTFTYYNGATWAHKEIHFNVAVGCPATAGPDGLHAGRCNRHGARDCSTRRPVHRQQPASGADPNYANIDVRNPAAGTWTAVLYSVAGAAASRAT